MKPEEVPNFFVELLSETVELLSEWNEPKFQGPLAITLVSKRHQSRDLEFEIRAAVDANGTLSVKCAWRILGGTEKHQIHRELYEVAANAANLRDTREWYERQLVTCREKMEVVRQAKIAKIGR